MLVSYKKLLAIIFTSIFLTSCDDSKEENLDDVSSESNIEISDSQKNLSQKVFNAMPARETIIHLINEGKSEYNAQFLSNPDKLNEYILESSRALNLGVYGADLNTANIYDQAQESMLFFKCVNILAKSIGVSDSFDENMGDRMTANQSNRDSTLSIISQAFTKADVTLRKNGRAGVSALLVSGLWIEGLYVACETAKETGNETIIKEIFQQNESLHNLIELLNSSELSTEVTFILAELKELKKLMEDKKDAVFTLQTLTVLNNKISPLRTKIISLK